MTKKHFIAIAESIRQQADQERETGALSTLKTTVTNLCHVFASENPRFDAARFTRACGVDQ